MAVAWRRLATACAVADPVPWLRGMVPPPASRDAERLAWVAFGHVALRQPDSRQQLKTGIERRIRRLTDSR